VNSFGRGISKAPIKILQEAAVQASFAPEE